MRLIKSVLLASIALSLAVPTAASAAKIKPGQYFAAGIIDVCLKSDGTWYYPTFAGNIGGWETTGLPDAQIIMWGSYNSGVGQDSMVVNKKGNVNWMEFHNDGSLVNFFDQQSFTFEKKECDPPGANRSPKANPSD